MLKRLNLLTQSEDSGALLIIDSIDLRDECVISIIDVLTERIKVADQITREVTLGLEVISQEKLAQHLPTEPFKERNYLSERTRAMAGDDCGNQLRIIGVVEIQKPEVLREVKVPAIEISTVSEAWNRS
jgi:hypothetical protein